MMRKQAQLAGEKWFFTGKPCKHGHISKRQVSNGACATCSSIRGKAFYHEPQRIEKHREEARRRMRDRLSAPGVLIELNARRRADRADPVTGQKIREAEAARRRKNPAKQREKQRTQSARRRADPVGGFALRASKLIRITLLKGSWKKPAKTESILGCTMDEFRSMIERQFQPGMSWSNMGEWHLDHIVPISTARTQAEAEALSRAGNFRPLWAKDNLEKSNSVIFLL